MSRAPHSGPTRTRSTTSMSAEFGATPAAHGDVQSGERESERADQQREEQRQREEREQIDRAGKQEREKADREGRHERAMS